MFFGSSPESREDCFISLFLSLPPLPWSAQAWRLHTGTNMDPEPVDVLWRRSFPAPGTVAAAVQALSHESEPAQSLPAAPAAPRPQCVAPTGPAPAPQTGHACPQSSVTHSQMELLDMTAGESRRQTMERVLRSRSRLLAIMEPVDGSANAHSADVYAEQRDLSLDWSNEQKRHCSRLSRGTADCNAGHIIKARDSTPRLLGDVETEPKRLWIQRLLTSRLPPSVPSCRRTPSPSKRRAASSSGQAGDCELTPASPSARPSPCARRSCASVGSTVSSSAKSRDIAGSRLGEEGKQDACASIDEVPPPCKPDAEQDVSWWDHHLAPWIGQHLIDDIRLISAGVVEEIRWIDAAFHRPSGLGNRVGNKRVSLLGVRGARGKVI